jgi:hypothetical protein
MLGLPLFLVTTVNFSPREVVKRLSKLYRAVKIFSENKKKPAHRAPGGRRDGNET